MKSCTAFRDDTDAVQFKYNLEAPTPRLELDSNPTFQLEIMDPETRELRPFLDLINSVFELCFGRKPEIRATASDLLKKFEGMRSALVNLDHHHLP
jgi:hypothetical protein